MTPVSPATLPPTTTRFYLPKGRIEAILIALVELQKRTDLSGKFARKCGRVRRAFAKAYETVVAETQDLQEGFKRRDGDGNVVRVVKLNPLGQIVFERDGDGKETDRPVIVPNEFYPIDSEAYYKALNAFSEEVIAIDCESFSDAELDAFKTVSGAVIDALMDLEPDSEYAKVPESADVSAEHETIDGSGVRTAP